MKFIGRIKEQALLKEKYKTEKAELIIIYGRRRLGKTSLIKKTLPKKGIYFLLTKEKPIQNLNTFKEELSKINPVLKQIQANTWEEYFRYAKNNIPKGTIIALDEFPYLVEQDKTIKSQFQKIYDEHCKERNIKLILCGSSLSIMHNLQGAQSPLYGRRTASIKLEPFTLYETSIFLEKDDEEMLKIHLATGGIPYYLEQLPNKKIEDLLKNNTIFLDEPNFLLNEEFRETANYFSILQSLAQGKNTFSEIADAAIIEKTTLSNYLTKLEQLQYIEKQKSFFDKQNTKKTRYTLADNFLHFWFLAIRKNEDNLNHVFGKLFEKEVKKIYEKKFEKVGTYFRKETEIDILAQKNNDILCIEVKFSHNKKNTEEKLKEKIQELPEKHTYKTKVITLENLQELIKLSKQ